MPQLFDRSIELAITKPTGFFTQGGNQIVIRDFRVQFKIEKTLGKRPNSAEFTITNLAERTQVEVQAKPLHVRADVGYDGGVQRLFSGDLRWAETAKPLEDWETKLHVGDGERAVRFARVTRAFKGGVKASDAVRELAAAMGLQVPRDLKGLDRQYVAGLTLSGRASDELDRVLTPLRKRWSVQDGRLVILGENEVRRDAAIVLAADRDGVKGNGVIGSPQLGSPDRKGQPPRLHLRTLLRPEVLPGARIKLFSREFNGALFKVMRVLHLGDTHSDRWETSIEGKPL